MTAGSVAVLADEEEEKTLVMVQPPADDDLECETTVYPRCAIPPPAPDATSSPRCEAERVGDTEPPTDAARLTDIDPPRVSRRARTAGNESGRLGWWWSRFRGRFFRRSQGIPPAPAPLAPPAPRRTGTLVSAGSRLSFSAYQAEEIMAALCLLETPHVAAVGQLADHIVAARAVGPDATAECIVLFALTRVPDEDGAVRLARLRARLAGVARSTIDQALVRLAEQGRITLLRATTPAAGSAALEHPILGIVDRCVLAEGALHAAP
jgi:hypothetical protein